MKSKKGAIPFNITLVVFLVAILIYAWLQLANKYGSFDRKIGEKQYELISIYQKAEKSLLYIDQSAKYSLQQSIYELASKGGYFNENECGSFSGVNSWAKIERDKDNFKITKCYPDDSIKENLLGIFNDTLNIYLADYPDVLIPASYDYELRGSLEVLGKAKESLVIDIVPVDFAVQPAITSKDPAEIYNQVSSGEIPNKLNSPMKSRIDVDTINKYHPEVLVLYTELCKRMGISTPPGPCTSAPLKCCITSGYRHPYYNKEIGGATNSPHQYGVALDVHVGKNVKEQLRWAKEASKLFTRVGIYPKQTDIHVDLMPATEGRAAYWIGSKGRTLETASNFNQLEEKANKYT